MPLDSTNTALIAGLIIVFAALVWLVREAAGRKRSARVEAYLRLEREAGTDRGQRSTTQIMKVLGMTAGQVRDAARRSRAIKRLATVTTMLSAESIMFEYAPW